MGVLGSERSLSSRFSILFPDFLQNEEVMVHDEIEDGVEQIVRPHLADAALPVAETIQQPGEEILLVLLEGKNHVAPENQADLLGLDFVPGFVVGQHLQDDVEVVPVLFHFRPLIRIEDVLQNQGVEGKTGPELFENLHLMDSGDIHPGYGRLGFEGETGLEVFKAAFLKILLVILPEGDAGRARSFFRRYG